MVKDIIKFLLVRDVKAPFRANEFDAGIDFFIPKFNTEFLENLLEKNKKVFERQLDPGEIYLVAGGNMGISTTLKNTYAQGLFGFDIEKGEPYFNLCPHQRIMIPSGVKSRMAKPGRALIAGNKSGIATKHGLVFGAQVVDYTYKGEIHLSLINTSNEAIRIYQNMKILQFMETPVFNSTVKVQEVDNISEDAFYMGLQDDRGEGGFGSTDKK